MTRLNRQDADLHYPDGSHRSTPASIDGRQLERHERRLQAHLLEHLRAGQPTRRRQTVLVDMGHGPDRFERFRCLVNGYMEDWSLAQIERAIVRGDDVREWVR